MSGELETLRGRLRALLQENMVERRRTMALLRDSERKVADQFGQIGSFQSAREEAAKRFRKGTNGDATLLAS
jgi:hypothetical protein